MKKSGAKVKKDTKDTSEMQDKAEALAARSSRIRSESCSPLLLLR
jgi:hypothetical protein